MECLAHTFDPDLEFKIEDIKMEVAIYDRTPNEEGIRLIQPTETRLVPLEDLIHQSEDPFGRTIENWLALRSYRFPKFVHEIRSIEFYCRDPKFDELFRDLLVIRSKKDALQHLKFNIENLEFDIINLISLENEGAYYKMYAEHYKQKVY